MTKLMCDAAAGPTSRKCYRTVRFKLTYPQISLVQYCCPDHLAAFILNGADEDQDMAKLEVEVVAEELMTKDQWKRVALGACILIINQALDNGELSALELQEYLPSGVDMPETGPDEQEFVKELQAVIEGQILSDLEEEAAKLDV